MLIEEAHSIVRDQIRKFKGAYQTPQQIDRALYRGLLDYYTSLFKTTDNVQKLNRYLKTVAHNTTGTFTLPADFQREVQIFALYAGKEYEGDLLTEQEFSDRRNSFILAPDYERPIARIRGSQITYLPTDGNFILSYYREVIKPVFAYDVVVRDIVFKEVGSVDLDVDASALNRVLINTMPYLGIALNEESLLMEKQVGNQ
jgi:hypothetical protein